MSSSVVILCKGKSSVVVELLSQLLYVGSAISDASLQLPLSGDQDQSKDLVGIFDPTHFLVSPSGMLSLDVLTGFLER